MSPGAGAVISTYVPEIKSTPASIAVFSTASLPQSGTETPQALARRNFFRVRRPATSCPGGETKTATWRTEASPALAAALTALMAAKPNRAPRRRLRGAPTAAAWWSRPSAMWTHPTRATTASRSSTICRRTGRSSRRCPCRRMGLCMTCSGTQREAAVDLAWHEYDMLTQHDNSAHGMA